MSKLNKKDIAHIASLAKLNLTDKEIVKYLDQLSEVVGYVDQLNEVDTSDISPTSQTTRLENVYRLDEIKPESCLDLGDILSGTDSTYNNLFKVPAILEERTDK